jgi:hypothetical protein
MRIIGSLLAGKYLAIHCGHACSLVTGVPPQKMQDRPLAFFPVSDTDREPTQKTQPKKGKPVEIPVPKKADVMSFLEKAAKTPDPESRASAGDKHAG